MSNFVKHIPAATLNVLKSCFDEAKLLYQPAKEAVKEGIVEGDSCRGRSSVFLGKGSHDSAHSYEGVSRDFNCWLPHLQTNAAIAFDDASDPNPGPRKLLDELTTSNRFEEIMNVGKVAVIRQI